LFLQIERHRDMHARSVPQLLDMLVRRHKTVLFVNRHRRWQSLGCFKEDLAVPTIAGIFQYEIDQLAPCTAAAGRRQKHHPAQLADITTIDQRGATHRFAVALSKPDPAAPRLVEPRFGYCFADKIAECRAETFAFWCVSAPV
jgi:hypothetical protein